MATLHNAGQNAAQGEGRVAYLGGVSEIIPEHCTVALDATGAFISAAAWGYIATAGLVIHLVIGVEKWVPYRAMRGNLAEKAETPSAK